MEICRGLGNQVFPFLCDHKISTVTVIDKIEEGNVALALAEGLALSTYQFVKYKKDSGKTPINLKTIRLLKHNRQAVK